MHKAIYNRQSLKDWTVALPLKRFKLQRLPNKSLWRYVKTKSSKNLREVLRGYGWLKSEAYEFDQSIGNVPIQFYISQNENDWRLVSQLFCIAKYRERPVPSWYAGKAHIKVSRSTNRKLYRKLLYWVRTESINRIMYRRVEKLHGKLHWNQIVNRLKAIILITACESVFKNLTSEDNKVHWGSATETR